MLLKTAPGLKPEGTFWFFAVVTLVGLAFAWFFLPETSGRSLEGMDELFSLPWTDIGRNGAALMGGSGSGAEDVETDYDAEKAARIAAKQRAEQVEVSDLEKDQTH